VRPICCRHVEASRCRFLAYLGEPIRLADLVCAPAHSLIHQSMRADEGKTPTNGDGFGLGWYAERPEPGLYREGRPAWSNENLRSLCEQVRSRLFFAHVRASTGTATTRANCHPFGHARRDDWRPIAPNQVLVARAHRRPGCGSACEQGCDGLARIWIDR